MRSRALIAGLPSTAWTLRYARQVLPPAPTRVARIWQWRSAPSMPPKSAPNGLPTLLRRRSCWGTAAVLPAPLRAVPRRRLGLQAAGESAQRNRHEGETSCPNVSLHVVSSPSWSIFRWGETFWICRAGRPSHIRVRCGLPSAASLCRPGQTHLGNVRDLANPTAFAGALGDIGIGFADCATEIELVRDSSSAMLR